MKGIVLAFVVFAAVGVHSLSEVAPEIVPVPGGKNGSGLTTRYWDCCKPSCSWKENINTPTMTPVKSCAIDGSTGIDAEVMSGCSEDGSSYMCTDQVSTVINSTLAYGFAAASFTGGADYNLCCACMLLSFQGKLSGKQMLVQVTNTGADLGVNQFDLATPGGGVGIYNGCSKQWNAPEDGWGDRYGGIHTVEECDQLPEVLQAGCRFRFEFVEGVDNPNVTFYQVKCPAELVAISNCDL